MATQGQKGGQKTGGKKKGYKAPHTLSAQEARKRLIERYLEEQEQIDGALLDKAKEGDVPAIKELYNRVYGQAMQAIEMSGKDGKDLIPSTDEQRNLAETFHALLRGTHRKD